MILMSEKNRFAATSATTFESARERGRGERGKREEKKRRERKQERGGEKRYTRETLSFFLSPPASSSQFCDKLHERKENDAGVREATAGAFSPTKRNNTAFFPFFPFQKFRLEVYKARHTHTKRSGRQTLSKTTPIEKKNKFYYFLSRTPLSSPSTIPCKMSLSSHLAASMSIKNGSKATSAAQKANAAPTAPVAPTTLTSAVSSQQSQISPSPSAAPPRRGRGVAVAAAAVTPPKSGA